MAKITEKDVVFTVEMEQVFQKDPRRVIIWIFLQDEDSSFDNKRKKKEKNQQKMRTSWVTGQLFKTKIFWDILAPYVSTCMQC